MLLTVLSINRKRYMHAHVLLIEFIQASLILFIANHLMVKGKAMRLVCQEKQIT